MQAEGRLLGEKTAVLIREKKLHIQVAGINVHTWHRYVTLAVSLHRFSEVLDHLATEARKVVIYTQIISSLSKMFCQDGKDDNIHLHILLFSCFFPKLWIYFSNHHCKVMLSISSNITTLFYAILCLYILVLTVAWFSHQLTEKNRQFYY